MISPAVRWALIIPTLLLVGVVIVVIAAEHAGHRWNVHGDLLGMFALFLGSMVLGLAVVGRALFKVVPTLARSPGQRNALNVACAGAGVAYVLFSIAVILWIA